MTAKEEVLQQLSKLIAEGERLSASFTLGDTGGYESQEPEATLQSFVTSALACVSRVAGKDSEYYRQVPARPPGRLAVPGFDPSFIPAVTGNLVALHQAVEGDLLTSLADRIRSRLHDDLLQQGAELLQATYHVAAMVVVGAVLENHLRRLVDRHGSVAARKGSISKYNDSLKDRVYTTAVWRRIQSIADLRNAAAHGSAGDVTAASVEEALMFVRRFLADYE